MRGKRAVDVRTPVLAPSHQRGRAHEDPRRAEATLRRAGCHERADESIPEGGVEAVEGGHRPPRNPLDRSDTRHPRLAVDEHGAAPALPLRRAAVLDRHDAEPLTQDIEERFARFALEVDRRAVALEHRAMTSCDHDPAG
jgi:hypothetical protein